MEAQKETRSMAGWKTAIAVAVNLMALGAIYATMRDDIRHSQEQISTLQAQKADEIGFVVKEHERRLNAHDADFLRVGAKLDEIIRMIGEQNRRASTEP